MVKYPTSGVPGHDFGTNIAVGAKVQLISLFDDNDLGADHFGRIGHTITNAATACAVPHQHSIEIAGYVVGHQRVVRGSGRLHRLPVGPKLLRDSVFDRLTEIRTAQARQLETQFRSFRNSLVIYTRGTTAIEAARAFTAGFDQLGDATISPAQQKAITDWYENQFSATTEHSDAADNLDGNEVDVEALLPSSNPQKYLQALYTAPFTDWDKAIENDDAGDGSGWSAANALFNGFFREIVTRSGFDDALLLDTRGNVVYTAYKGSDLGTNIYTGPYKGGELSEAYREALNSNTVDYVAVTDFGIYQPSGTPTAWMVSPIGGGGRIEGVLALQFPISVVNQLMTMDGKWEESGLGETGETYLVGPDGLMRSDSRLFLENPEQFKADVIEAGTPPGVAEQSILHGGTTLVQPVSDEASKLAGQGQSGSIIERDYLGQGDPTGLRPAGPDRTGLVGGGQDRHRRGVRPGHQVHAHPGALDRGDDLRGVHRRDPAGPRIRPAHQASGGRRPADQRGRLRRRAAGGVPRRIR